MSVRLGALSHIALIKIAGAGLGFLFHVALARLLGQEEYGVFAYATSIALLLVIPGRLGFDLGTLRFLPRLLERGEGQEKPFLRVSGLTVLGCATVVSASFLVALYFLELTPEVQAALVIVGIFLPLRVIWDIGRARLQALQAVSLALAPYLVGLPLLTLSLSGAVYWRTGSLTAAGALALQGGAMLVLYALGQVFLKRKLPATTSNASATFNREWLTVSVILGAASAMQAIYAQSDIVVLGLVMSPTEISAYAAAAKVAVLAAFGLEIVNFRYAPLIARAFPQGGARLQDTVTDATRKIVLFTLPAAVFVQLFAEDILKIFGEGFSEEGAMVLRILVLGQMISALCGPVGFVCSMTNQERLLARVVLLSACANIAGNFVMAHFYGLTGAAVATAAVVSARNLVLARAVKSMLGVSMAFWRKNA